MTDGGVQGSGGPPETSTTFLGRVRALEPDAWRRFVDLYGPLIYHWCRKSGCQEADAADIGQEVFRAVARTINNFQREQASDSLRGWLRVITRNKVRDFFSNPQLGLEGVGGSEGRLLFDGFAALEANDTADGANPEEEGLLLRRALDLVLSSFKDESRQAFLRVVVDRCDPNDVARELGITVNAVYLAKARIKRRLREEFADLLDL